MDSQGSLTRCGSNRARPRTGMFYGKIRRGATMFTGTSQKSLITPQHSRAQTLVYQNVSFLGAQVEGIPRQTDMEESKMLTMASSILVFADYFILLLFRVSGLILASPIFGRINIPQIAKIGLIVSLTFLFFTVFPQTAYIRYSTLMGFMLIALGELLLGIALAFVTNVFFALVAFTAGQMIDMQIGFGIVNVFDAQNNMQAPMMGNFLNLMLLLMFFVVNGHLKLIETIYLTLERIPVGTLIFSGGIGLTALEVFARAFLLGVMVALPILASGLMLEICFGMLMRTVPQIHMFVVGIPLKMLVGIIIFLTTIPVFTNFSIRVFDELFVMLERMFAHFAA